MKSPAGPRNVFVAALQAGHGALADNQELAALMKTVDTKSPLWLVGRFNDTIDKEAGSTGLKTLTIDTKAAKDGTEFTFQAGMADADKAKALVETVSAGLKSALEEVKRDAATTPSLKPVADMLGSIQVSADGATGTMTGQLPAGILRTIIGQVPLGELLAPDEPPVDIAPPQPAPPPEVRR